MLGGNVALLAGIAFEVEEAHGPGLVAGLKPRIVGGLGLFVRGQDGHAVGPSRVNPALARSGQAQVLGWEHVQLPSVVTRRRKLWPLVPEDDRLSGVHSSRNERNQVLA